MALKNQKSHILSYHRFGRESFQDSMKLVHRMEESQIDWSKFKYMVFDIPKHEGTYRERYQHLCMFLIMVIFPI